MKFARDSARDGGGARADAARAPAGRRRYAIYQIECGAQVIQMFDSWAGNLAPADYDVFALPYQKRVVEQIKKAHPDVPLISYIAKSAALLERMRDNGCDIVSVDWTVTMSDARARLGPDVGVQGNLESAVLLSNPELIEERTLAVIKEAGPTGHIMNLGTASSRGRPRRTPSTSSTPCATSGGSRDGRTAGGAWRGRVIEANLGTSERERGRSRYAASSLAVDHCARTRSSSSRCTRRTRRRSFRRTSAGSRTAAR